MTVQEMEKEKNQIISILTNSRISYVKYDKSKTIPTSVVTILQKHGINISPTIYAELDGGEYRFPINDFTCYFAMKRILCVWHLLLVYDKGGTFPIRYSIPLGLMGPNTKTKILDFSK